MRQTLAVAVLASLSLAVPTLAAAQAVTLTATLNGNAETPPPGVNTGAFGTATVVVDVAARTVSYRIDVFNMPSGTTASHIHVGGAGTTGPVIVNFAPPVNASNDYGFAGTVPEGQFLLRPELGIRSADDVFQAILAGNAYVNVHSAANPGGEVRGQLTRQP